jgi:hypothetical protein
VSSDTPRMPSSYDEDLSREPGMDSDHDPEQHSFEVREATENDLTGKRGHILEVTRPTHGNGGYVMSTCHDFNLAELTDLHDRLGEYLDEHRGH